MLAKSATGPSPIPALEITVPVMTMCTIGKPPEVWFAAGPAGLRPGFEFYDPLRALLALDCVHSGTVYYLSQFVGGTASLGAITPGMGFKFSGVMINPPSLNDLASRPQYYLSGIDLNSGTAEFVELARDTLKRASFLDDRMLMGISGRQRVALRTLQDAVEGIKNQTALAPINYILHTGFSCSTLISRCFDMEGVCTALREPRVFWQLANYKRQLTDWNLTQSDWRELFDNVLFLLAKCHAPAEATVIKPMNSANNLADEVVAHPRTGGVVLLYSGLEQFLVSMLKKGEVGGFYVRKLYEALRNDLSSLPRLGPAEQLRLTDLQMAAFVWHVQVDACLQLFTRFSNARVRTLNCEEFLAHPEEVLRKLYALFAINADDQMISAIVSGPVLQESSKNLGRAYSVATRREEHRQILRRHGPDVGTTIRWCEDAIPVAGLRQPLPLEL